MIKNDPLAKQTEGVPLERYLKSTARIVDGVVLIGGTIGIAEDVTDGIALIVTEDAPDVITYKTNKDQTT
ncbi:hypothetical protein [Herbaspirillum huttiense]|uniref:hypothetical protein n=1 Tax=Herbaspirillum huttiense TaxID=863372 RepID=UPI003B3AAFF1